jgi:glyoxylase I family protein
MSIMVGEATPHLEIFDMLTSVRFYRDVLGFTLAATSGSGDDCGWALLRLGGSSLMLNTAYDDGERPPDPDPARVAAHRDTTIYFSCSNVDEAYEYLRSKGLDVGKPRIAYYGMKQLYVADPDGFMLCFQCPAAKDVG